MQGAEINQLGSSKGASKDLLAMNLTIKFICNSSEVKEDVFFTFSPSFLRYQRLLKGRSLDPLSQKKLSSVESKYLYLRQQLQETNAALDLEWNEHLRKNKGHVSIFFNFVSFLLKIIIYL